MLSFLKRVFSSAYSFAYSACFGFRLFDFDQCPFLDFGKFSSDSVLLD